MCSYPLGFPQTVENVLPFHPSFTQGAALQRFGQHVPPLPYFSLMHELKTGVYIDGLNFYYGALRDTNEKWVDLHRFAQLLVPRDRLVHIRYFTAIVNTRPHDQRVPIRQSTYLRAISTLPLVSIHQGRFISRVKTRVLADAFEPHSELFTPHFRPASIFSLMWHDKVRRRTDSSTRARVIIDEEKGSDVNIGAFLVNDAARRSIDKAIVVSNDSDLTEAIRLARGFDISVGILNPHSSPTSKHLRSAASFEIPFRESVLRRVQLPNTVIDSLGREIHKPREWRQTQRPGQQTGPRTHQPKRMSG